MARGIFITGTDTGVGKTFVACGLAFLLRDAGYRLGVMKPAETGCPERDGKLMPEDAIRLKEASGCAEPLEKICPYRLPEPLAPSIAAERARVRIDVDHLIAVYDDISSKHDVTLVEGAGGLMVPLLPSYTYADLAGVLKLPIVVVAANRLGAINHLLLTLEHASCKGLRVLGYVLNQMESVSSLAAETNRQALFTITSVPCLGEIPYLELDQSNLTEIFGQQLDLRALESVLR
ncbi:MAG TPA: dethiobiotin synthase [Candidatus Binatia bacterium]|nr:dethiobiotin synthase [Candidatus Binatia bacterium]